MGMSFDDVRVELECLENLLEFLNDNGAQVGSRNGGILFEVDGGSKILVKKERENLQAIFVPNDMETSGLILSILLEKCKTGNHIIFGYLESFLDNIGIESKWNKEDNIFKINESDNTWYIVMCTDNGIGINKYDSW